MHSDLWFTTDDKVQFTNQYNLQLKWNMVFKQKCCQCQYPTGQNYSLELMFAEFATAKIAKDLNPLKQSTNRLQMPEDNIGVL